MLPSDSIDHLVVTAPNLAEGVAWLSSRLRLGPMGGGAHPGMGTHNALWAMGSVYLEVIAPDPSAPPPARPRLFGLDDPGQRPHAPRLAHWVVRRAGLSPADLPVSGHEWLSMSRGDLRWRLSAAADGRMGFDGALPSLIEWEVASVPRHPTLSLPDQGLRLRRLGVQSVNIAHLRSVYAALGMGTWLEQDYGFTLSPRLWAEIDTPSGMVRL